MSATPLNALTSLLGSNQISFEQDGLTENHVIPTDAVWFMSGLDAADGEAWIHSEMPLRVIMWKGNGGALLATPDQPIPGSDEGRSWTIPLIPNSHSIHLESDSPFTLEWETTSASGSGSSSSLSVVQAPLGETDTIHSWQGEIVTSQSEQLVLRTSAPARMVLHWGDAAELDGCLLYTSPSPRD